MNYVWNVSYDDYSKMLDDLEKELVDEMRINTIIEEPIIGYKRAFNYSRVTGVEGEFNLPLNEVIITIEIPAGTRVCCLRKEFEETKLYRVINKKFIEFIINKDIHVPNETMAAPSYMLYNMLKCRAEKAIVKKIEDCKNNEKILHMEYPEAISSFDRDFIYKKGDLITVNNYDETLNYCAAGIHFFKHLSLAEAHCLY